MVEKQHEGFFVPHYDLDVCVTGGAKVATSSTGHTVLLFDILSFLLFLPAFVFHNAVLIESESMAFCKQAQTWNSRRTQHSSASAQRKFNTSGSFSIFDHYKSSALSRSRNVNMNKRCLCPTINNSSQSVQAIQHKTCYCIIKVLCYTVVTKKGAELKGKALNLLVSLCSFPHLWSWRMGHDRKNEIADTRSWNGIPQEGGWRLPKI